MSDLLIPFGIHQQTGAIVEPEDAAKGRACNCLCPGCKAPLLCRHPQQMRDHFAHDSRHEHAKPEQECPFSSTVAVAMMLREMAPSCVGKLLCTPELSVVEHCPVCRYRESILVTRAASNRIDEAVANVTAYGHRVDLKLTVSGFTVLVDLVYRGKPATTFNKENLQAERVALLELNCDNFSIKALKRNRKIRFSQAIVAYFLNARNKRWRFHPRTHLLQEQMLKKHHCQPRIVTPHKTETRQQFTKPLNRRYAMAQNAKKMALEKFLSEEPELEKAVTVRPFLEKTVPKKPLQSRQEPAVKQALHNPQEQMRDYHIIKRFECVLCHLSWEHHGNRAWKCPQCNSHLYAREIK